MRVTHLCVGVLLGLLAFPPTADSEDTRLISAVKAGDRAAVTSLLRNAGAANEAEVDGTTALHWAVRADDEQMVRLLLRGGASAIAANRYGVTPLALAANNGNAGVIRALLEAGADANTTLAEGETVLMRAARSGSVPAIQALLEHGAQVNAAEGWLGETALMWAASENHASAVRLLVEKGAQIDARSKLIEFPDLKYPSTGLVRMVLPRGGWTPLMYAARQGSLEAVRTLSNLKADLNVKDPDGLTALVIAILNAHYEVAAALVENGADPNLADVSGRAALYALADMHTLAPMFSRPAPVPTGQLDALGLAKVLLARGARPNQVLTRALLPRHHNPGDRTMGEGSTPFMRAAQGGDVALMRLLLDSGADAALTQKNGTTALMLAAGGPGDSLQEEDAIAALELCLEKGLDINAVNTAGETAVHRAVDSGANDVVRFLAARGARLDVKNKRGSTPLDVALADGRDGDRTATIALLKELLAAGK